MTLYFIHSKVSLILFPIRAFINLAAELDLWVILRPGPYISSELDLGGLPRCVCVAGSGHCPGDRGTSPGFVYYGLHRLTLLFLCDFLPKPASRVLSVQLAPQGQQHETEDNVPRLHSGCQRLF